MATYRNNQSSYPVGEKPPEIQWRFVKGDTASFRLYVTDDKRLPLDISAWNIDMQIKRPTTFQETFEATDEASLVLSLQPAATADDEDGEFTVSITSAQSSTIQTGDIFDIQLSLPQDQIVWTVAQGRIEVIEDITS